MVLLIHSTSKRPFFILLTLFSSPAKPWSALCIANGDKEFNAPLLTGSIIKKRGQLSVHALEVFFVDSSSDVEESETSVQTRLRVPSGCVFVFFWDILKCL